MLRTFQSCTNANTAFRNNALPNLCLLGNQKQQEGETKPKADGTFTGNLLFSAFHVLYTHSPELAALFCTMDQEKKTIDCFRNRLKQLIRVAPVLDMIHFLSDEQKEQIKAKLQNEGEIKAADLLLQEIISKTYPEGWFRELLTALERVGCKQAANYMENNPPSPSLEAENDTYTRLIDLLSLTLINMKTPDVCHKCYELHILTAEDRETVSMKGVVSMNRFPR